MWWTHEGAVLAQPDEEEETTVKISEVVLEVNEKGQGRLVVDGEPLLRVRDVQIDARAQQLTKVHVTLAPVRVRFVGAAEVVTVQEDGEAENAKDD